MALSVSQAMTLAFPKIAAKKGMAADQFTENAFLRFLKKKGMIKAYSGGRPLTFPLSWRMNAGAKVLASPTDTVSTSLTDVLTEAQYSKAEIGVPIVWSRADEDDNRGENAKVKLVKNLINGNGFNSHDNLLEGLLFGSTSNEFHGLQTVLADSGQSNVGGIDASTETFWRHHSAEYQADGSDIDAVINFAWAKASKGTGSSMAPDLIVAGYTGWSTYVSSLVETKRFNDTQNVKAGIKSIDFNGGDFIFSQKETDGRIYGLNSDSFGLYYIEGSYRDLEPEDQAFNGFTRIRKLYSAVQFCSDNLSRGFVLTLNEGT